MAFQSSLEGGALPPEPSAQRRRAMPARAGLQYVERQPSGRLKGRCQSGAVTRPAELMDSSWPAV